VNAAPRRPFLKKIVLIVGIAALIGAAYFLSLGPMLWFADRHGTPYWIWYLYDPIFRLWASGVIPYSIEQIYYEQYLQWWTDYLPYDYLIDHQLV
jgi:hypothetical protein